MYWNDSALSSSSDSSAININMRCIEIYGVEIVTNAYLRLTLTWDVLKWLFNVVILCDFRLTLTWDVLKCLNLLITDS